MTFAKKKELPVTAAAGLLLLMAVAHVDAKTCVECHASVQGVASAKLPHAGGSFGCDSCHADHTAKESTAAAKGRFKLTLPANELCQTCHTDTVEGKEFAHEPAKKDCTICHNPHSAAPARLRTADANTLCMECHSTATQAKFETEAPVQLFGGQVTLPARPYENLRLLDLADHRGHPVSHHPVLRKADAEWPAVTCTSCHNAHGGNTAAQLNTKESETTATLCQRCHK